jgi:hypothetical protein
MRVLSWIAKVGGPCHVTLHLPVAAPCRQRQASKHVVTWSHRGSGVASKDRQVHPIVNSKFFKKKNCCQEVVRTENGPKREGSIQQRRTSIEVARIGSNALWPACHDHIQSSKNPARCYKHRMPVCIPALLIHVRWLARGPCQYIPTFHCHFFCLGS